jgi:excisionase family DNA binding protein
VKEEDQSNGAARSDFLTARQLATILQVSESTVRRLAHAGRIPSIRITPHIIRFNLQAVTEALDGTHRSRSQRRAAHEDPADDSQLTFPGLF